MKKGLALVAICLSASVLSSCSFFEFGSGASSLTSSVVISSSTSSTTKPSLTSTSAGGNVKPSSTTVTNPENPDSLHFGDAVTINNKSFYKDFTTEEKNLYYTLWDEKTSVSLKIDIEQEELKKINEAFVDYMNNGRYDSTKIDTYRRCNLTITVNGTDYRYEEVGIRMRGNTSRTDFCDDEGKIYNFVHFRFNLSETFDGEEYQEGTWGNDIYHEWTDNNERSARKSRSFATMEKFYYKWNKNYDQTYIREIYANRMFQDQGVLAPHITLTQLSIKQGGEMENLGVGNLYETVDKKFIKRNFDKEHKGGDLYKCTYANGKADLSAPQWYGVETPTNKFTYSLKTNDDRTAPDYNHNKYLLALIDALARDKNDSNFKSELEKIVDMDYFTRFEAANYVLGNPDCIRNNFNNYYLYFTPQGEAYIIPYDYDRCLGINYDWNPTGNGMMTAEPYSPYSWAGDNTNPLYTKTILSNGIREYKELYQSKLNQILNSNFVQYSNFEKIYNAYKATYQDMTMPSEAIRNNCHNIRMDRFVFSDQGINNYDTQEDNISVRDYLNGKLQTLRNTINNI